MQINEVSELVDNFVGVGSDRSDIINDLKLLYKQVSYYQGIEDKETIIKAIKSIGELLYLKDMLSGDVLRLTKEVEDLRNKLGIWRSRRELI